MEASVCCVLMFQQVYTKSVLITACSPEIMFKHNNKSSPKSFGKSRIATPHGREWTRPLHVLAVQCPLQMSPITQLPVWYIHSTQRDTHPFPKQQAAVM